MEMVQRSACGWERHPKVFDVDRQQEVYTSPIELVGRVDIDPRGAWWRAELQNALRGMPTMKKTNMLRQLTLLGAALTLLLGFGVAQATTYTVTTTADSSDGACTSSLCSLRDAITAANADTAADTINFSIPSSDTGCASPNVCTILLGSTLPVINNSGTEGPLMIDGTGQSITISGAGTYQVMVNSGGILTINRLTIEDGNTSGPGGGEGGAILVYTNGVTSLTITNSTFSGNSASITGGAIYTCAPTTITNSTFYNNSTTGNGGAISSCSTLTVTNSTFDGNTTTAAGEGGAIASSNPTMLYNTILANSTGGNCGNMGGAVVPTDDGGNLSDDSSCGATITQVTDPNLNLAAAPANNGGPTYTIALMSPSTAIGFDKANCPATDQRGVPRPSSTLCDAGAYQTVTPPTLTCPTNTAQVGVAYSSALVVSGGVSPYTYSISSGSLPDGLNLNTSTGVITGMPGTMGLFTFTGKVVDSPLDGSQTGSTSPSCQIKVSPAAVLLQLSVTPTSLPFGSVYQFSLLLKTVTLKNTGTGAISLGRVSVTPGTGADRNNFTPLSFCPSSLAVGKSCAIIVVLFADNLGSLSATLNIPNNATTSPQAVALSATVTKRGH
jgi:CSLREA domain-containing protein